MDCWRLGGTYKSTLEGMPSMYGSYIYSITYLEKGKSDNFRILTERGLLYKTRSPRLFFSNKYQQVDGLIVDYINAFLDWDKKILQNYCSLLKSIGINKIIKDPTTSAMIDTYDRKRAIHELLFIKKLLNTKELCLVFLNTNISNLYKL